MLTKVKPGLQLKDSSLFRQQCYINGAWVDADNKSTFAVYNPADGVQIGTVPTGAPNQARNQAARAAAGMARQDRERASYYPAQVVRTDHGEPGRPCGADDDRAGQAAF